MARMPSSKSGSSASNPEGNHGEDLKDYMFHLGDATGGYPKRLQISPAPLSLETLREENRQRDRSQPEFELVDTGIFKSLLRRRH